MMPRAPLMGYTVILVLYLDTGKQNGNYYLGFRVYSLGVMGIIRGYLGIRVEARKNNQEPRVNW